MMSSMIIFHPLNLCLVLALINGSDQTCVLPKTPAHARLTTRVQNTVPAGGYIRYMCAENAILAGHNTLTCGPNGQWNRSPPRCYPTGDSGKITARPSSKSIIQTTTTTRPTTQPTTRKAGCEPHPKLRFGRVTTIGYLRAGLSTVYLSCYNGYELSGPQKLKCSHSGSWEVLTSVGNARTTTCQRKPTSKTTRGTTTVPPTTTMRPTTTTTTTTRKTGCRPHPKLRFGRVTTIGYLRAGLSTVYLSCHDGYELVGPKKLKCSHSGTWVTFEAVGNDQTTTCRKKRQRPQVRGRATGTCFELG